MYILVVYTWHRATVNICRFFIFISYVLYIQPLPIGFAQLYYFHDLWCINLDSRSHLISELKITKIHGI